MKFAIFLKSSLLLKRFYLLSFQFINKTLRLHNLNTRVAINAKISVFVICAEAIIYLLIYIIFMPVPSIKDIRTTLLMPFWKVKYQFLRNLVKPPLWKNFTEIKARNFATKKLIYRYIPFDNVKQTRFREYLLNNSINEIWTFCVNSLYRHILKNYFQH